jgi:hypothetical protein
LVDVVRIHLLLVDDAVAVRVGDDDDGGGFWDCEYIFRDYCWGVGGRMKTTNMNVDVVGKNIKFM